MVRITGFDNYFFCPKTCEIYSIRQNKIKAIKPLRGRGAKIVYGLYKNGQKKIISKFDIIKSVIHKVCEVEKEKF